MKLERHTRIVLLVNSRILGTNNNRYNRKKLTSPGFTVKLATSKNSPGDPTIKYHIKLVGGLIIGHRGS